MYSLSFCAVSIHNDIHITALCRKHVCYNQCIQNERIGNGYVSLFRRPIIPTTHCSDSPLFRRPIVPTAHYSDDPLFRPHTHIYIHFSVYTGGQNFETLALI